MLSIIDHLYAAIDDKPKTVTEIHREAQLYYGKRIARSTVHAGIQKIVQAGCAVRSKEDGHRTKYQEPQDHFSERHFEHFHKRGMQ